MGLRGAIAGGCREAQAKELRVGPGATALPVIYAGDCNSSAADPADLTFSTYKSPIDAGLTDASTLAHPGDPGLYLLRERGPAQRRSEPDATNRSGLLIGPFGVDGWW